MNRLWLTIPLALASFAPLRAEAPDAKKTIDWVQSLRQTGGAFASAPKGLPGLRATSSAIRTLKYLGAEIADPKSAGKFVEACFVPATGGFADTPGGQPDVATTAVGLMAVAELKLPREKFVAPAMIYLAENAKGFEEIRIAAAGYEAVGTKCPKAEEWLAEIAKNRNSDGTYGKGDGMARDTGGSVAAVLRLGGKVDQQENVIKALKAGQRPDGGYGKADAKSSDLETTYRVARSFHMLKATPDVKALHGLVEKCRNADGGYGVVPGQPSTISGSYFASIIRHWFPLN